MPQITYIEPSGQQATVHATEGWSQVQAATAHGVDGIVGERGGPCACATGHSNGGEARAGDLPAPSLVDPDMVAHVAAERWPNSRPGCQIKASAAVEGLTVTLPETQA